MTAHVSLEVVEQSQLGEARRLAVSLAAKAGFGEEARGRVAVVVTEMVRNAIVHGGGGEILLRSLANGGVEMIAIDKGPGMESIGRCLEDGYSTAGTPGNGMGAIARMADLFDLYSAPGLGTALLVRLFATRPAALHDLFDVGVVCVPKRGEEACGDSWYAAAYDGAAVFAVIDGLGHGTFAAVASREAVAALSERDARDPASAVGDMHARLRATRGAAAAVAIVDRSAGAVRYAGIGNIAGSVDLPAGSRSMVSHNGTLGHEVRRIQEFTYPWDSSGMLVMHSDGLGSRWSLGRYPGLAFRHPSLVAAVLYRDHARGRDDVTVLVAREARAEEAA